MLGKRRNSIFLSYRSQPSLAMDRDSDTAAIAPGMLARTCSSTAEEPLSPCINITKGHTGALKQAHLDSIALHLTITKKVSLSRAKQHCDPLPGMQFISVLALFAPVVSASYNANTYVARIPKSPPLESCDYQNALPCRKLVLLLQ